MDKGLTQSDMRDRYGLYVSNYARGVCSPGAQKLRDICTVLECSADWLLGMSDRREPEGKRTDELPPIVQYVKRLRVECPGGEDERKRYRILLGNTSTGYMPTARTLSRVAEDYGCTVDYLLGLGE